MNKYPVQDKPLYGFHVVDGRLVKDTHIMYLEIVRQGYIRKTNYKFAKNMGISNIGAERLDKYLNGYLYTFDPDKDRALHIMRSTVRKKIGKAREELAKLEQKMEILDAMK